VPIQRLFRRLITVALVAFAMAAWVAPAEAGIVFYNSRAVWNAAHPGSALENFSSMTAGAIHNGAPGGTMFMSTQTESGYNYNHGYDQSHSWGYNSTSSPTTYNVDNTIANAGSTGPTNFGTGNYLAAGGLTGTYSRTGTYSSESQYWGCSPGCYWRTSGYFYEAFNYGSNDSGPLSLTLPAGVTSVAFDAGQWLSGGNQNHVINVQARTASGAVQTASSVNVFSTWSFFGFASDDASDPIMAVTITPVLNPISTRYLDTDTSWAYYNNNNSRYRQWYDYTDTQDYSKLALDNFATYAATPEPSSVILLLTIGGLLFRGYRRRAAKLQRTDP
jgi:hypothetical protein